MEGIIQTLCKRRLIWRFFCSNRARIAKQIEFMRHMKRGYDKVLERGEEVKEEIEEGIAELQIGE